VIIIEDLLGTEDALRAVVEGPEWKDASKGSDNTGKYSTCCMCMM